MILFSREFTDRLLLLIALDSTVKWVLHEIEYFTIYSLT